MESSWGIAAVWMGLALLASEYLLRRLPWFAEHELPAQREPLPLTSGELPPSRKQPAEHRVVSLRQIVHHVRRPRFLARTLNSHIVCKRGSPAEADILPRGHLVLTVVLKNNAHLALYAAGTEACGVHTVQ